MLYHHVIALWSHLFQWVWLAWFRPPATTTESLSLVCLLGYIFLPPNVPYHDGWFELVPQKLLESIHFHQAYAVTPRSIVYTYGAHGASDLHLWGRVDVHPKYREHLLSPYRAWSIGSEFRDRFDDHHQAALRCIWARFFLPSLWLLFAWPLWVH